MSKMNSYRSKQFFLLWFRIIICFLLIGIVAGTVPYLIMENDTGFLIGAGISLCGLTTGIILANRKSRVKKTAVNHYLIY